MKTIEWAAGLFEGEGCIVKRKDRNLYRLQLVMTDLDVVQDFRKVVGLEDRTIETINRSDKPTHYKQQYAFRIYKKADVVRVLSAMLPYLGQRRAYKALNCLDDIELN